MTISSNFKTVVILLISCFSLGCSSDETNQNGNDNGGSEAYRTGLAVGESAKDLLTENSFSKLSIEIGYMEGFALTSQAQREVENFLAEHLHKSQGVEIIQTEIPSQSKENYSAQDLRAIETESRQLFPAENEIKVWVSIVNGKFENESVIGLAYQNLSA